MKAKLVKENLKYTDEIVAQAVIDDGSITPEMVEDEIISVILNKVGELYGKQKQRYYANVDQDFLSDALQYIENNL